MKINYDPKLKVMGIGLTPWSRLGPSKWFPDYKIASLYEWDVTIENAPEVVALNTKDRHVELHRLNTPSMLKNPVFQDLLIKNFKDYNAIAYKAVDVPEILVRNGMKFLTNGTAIATSLENKAFFRRMFAPLGIPFPEYRIYEMASLEPSRSLLNDFLNGEEAVIVQDSQVGGGKGTFIVRDMSTLEYCFESLSRMKYSGTLVVSKKIESAHERSVQCVATRYGIFVGPLQKQIIAHPLLANLSVADGDKFCGIESNPDDTYASSYAEIKQLAEKIGDELIGMGYKGIFGLDCLVDESGKVFALEVNPRITGATPLQTMLYRKDIDIPFYLLHILELTDSDYTIEDASLPGDQPVGSLMMVHAQNDRTQLVTETIQSGLYDDQLSYKKASIQFDENDDRQVLLQRYIPLSFRLKPGGRTSCIFTNYPVLSNDDTLNDEAVELVREVQSRTTLEEITTK